jgi:hypothetical protein
LVSGFLIRSALAPEGDTLASALSRSGLLNHGLREATWAFTSSAENGRPMAHILLSLSSPVAVSALERERLQSMWRAAAPPADSISRLEVALDRPGLSDGQTPLAHYAVETDPAPGWSDEIGRWYAEEHLPGLASVPGCIRARRYLNLDTGPRSLACYDLESLDVLGSEAWLKVRQTAWSDTCRPHFTNTLRTRFPSVGTITLANQRSGAP